MTALRWLRCHADHRVEPMDSLRHEPAPTLPDRSLPYTLTTVRRPNDEPLGIAKESIRCAEDHADDLILGLGDDDQVGLTPAH
jgi:hypothetical protein